MIWDILAVAFFVWVIWRFCVNPLLQWLAPIGYEADDGFHYGREP